MSGTKAPGSHAKSFNNSSFKGSADTWLYWLLWNLAYHAAEIVTDEDLEEKANAFLPDRYEGSDAVKALLISLKDFANEPTGEDRRMRAGDFVEKHSKNLRVPSSIRIQPDITLEHALAEATVKYSCLEDLPKNSKAWGLTEKVAAVKFEALNQGLDPMMLIMQVRAESSFRNDAISPKGAIGISQFMPGTGAKYGLHTIADFYDPKKSIHAMAQHMGDLTRQYGSQELALAAYNGGRGAVKHLQRNLGEDITAETMIAYWDERGQRIGTHNKSAWHVETKNYVEKIVFGARAFETTQNTLIASNKAGLSGAFDESVSSGIAAPPLVAREQDAATKTTPALTLGG